MTSSQATGCGLRSQLVAYFALLSMLLPGLGTAQSDKPDKHKPGEQKEEKWREDPYTKNDATAIKEAGYVKFAPLAWTDKYDSKRIEQALGDVKVRWIETAHCTASTTLGNSAIMPSPVSLTMWP